jgi:hypothetical protein
MSSWPSREEAEMEALAQEASCICSSMSAGTRPCGACRAGRMIRALLKELRAQMPSIHYDEREHHT